MEILNLTFLNNDCGIVLFLKFTKEG